MPENSRANTGSLSTLGGAIIQSRIGRVFAALFIIVEVYRLSIGPIFLQSAELKKKWAELHVATAEAESSLKMKQALAEKTEAEADTAEETGHAAPELEAAIAKEITEKGKLLTASAANARDVARTLADKTEGEAASAEAKANIAERTAENKISATRSDYQTILSLLQGFYKLGNSASQWRKMVIVQP